jgi:heparan-alpha-glucosaminide N-acetyltransferase
VLMIFVQGGGGGYWFFRESKWNGFTVADFIAPWFIFITGTSVALSFNSLEAQRVFKCILASSKGLLVSDVIQSYTKIDNSLLPGDFS